MGLRIGEFPEEENNFLLHPVVAEAAFDKSDLTKVIEPGVFGGLAFLFPSLCSFFPSLSFSWFFLNVFLFISDFS